MNQPVNIRKITVHIPVSLLKLAQKQTGAGVTETIRQGLKLLGAREAYNELRRLRGKVEFTIDLDELRDDSR